MKERLLQWIICPMCRESLRLERFAGNGEETEAGSLSCEGCHRVYPVIGGIPRLLPDDLLDLCWRYQPEFFRKYKDRLPLLSSQPSAEEGEKDPGLHQRRTHRSYSYQWRKFREMFPHWEQVFRDAIQPIQPEFFKGKLGLDAGCGFGRHLVHAAAYGAEIIGMDLSEAVEAARDNARHLPNTHFVQGDIFRPPFRERSLDFVYSIGVLHVMQRPQEALRSLARLLKPGAPIFIWLNARGRGRQIALLNTLRRVTTRMPYPLLNGLCILLAAAQWVLWIWPYQLLNAFKSTRPLAQKIPFSFHARYPFRVLHTDWFNILSVPLMQFFRKEEVGSWFEGLERVTLAPEWGKLGGAGRALGYAPMASQPVSVPR